MRLLAGQYYFSIAIRCDRAGEDFDPEAIHFEISPPESAQISADIFGTTFVASATAFALD